MGHTNRPMLAVGARLYLGTEADALEVAVVTKAAPALRSATEANAARIAACWNALAGLDPAGLAGAVVALEAVRDTGGPTENMRHADALDLIDDLRRIARLALAALRGKGG